MNQKNKPLTQQRREVIATSQSISVRQCPLPSPEDVESYERIFPGAAQEIFEMAKLQQKTQLEIKRAESDSAIKVNHTGQKMAFAITMAALGLSGYSLSLGHETAAAILGATPFLNLIASFLKGSSIQKDVITKNEIER